MQEKNENNQLSPADLEQKLWDYIDGSISPEERTSIDRFIASNEVWKAKYRELLLVNELLQSSELSAPSMRFTKNVMEEIGRLHIAPATRTYINKRIIWGIGIFFITLIIAFIAYGLGQVNWKSSEESNLPVDLSSIDYSKVFSNNFVNVFMMINVVLGLILFDRYLSIRKKNAQQKRTNEV